MNKCSYNLSVLLFGENSKPHQKEYSIESQRGSGTEIPIRSNRRPYNFYVWAFLMDNVTKFIQYLLS
jgi:hypothetical protein